MLPPTLELKLAQVISGAILGERVAVAEALDTSVSRVNHICRCDDDHHRPYATELFEIYALAGRPERFWQLFEELYNLRVVDLTRLVGRDPNRKGLILALRGLTEVLERYDDARQPDSDGGAEITQKEWREIGRPLDDVLGRLVAFRDSKGKQEG